MKFRKKPVVIDAFLWTGDHEQLEDPEWCIEAIQDGKIFFGGSGLATTMNIQTLEGVTVARFGDWIIRGVTGEIYPCKPDIFEATYEKVEE